MWKQGYIDQQVKKLQGTFLADYQKVFLGVKIHCLSFFFFFFLLNSVDWYAATSPPLFLTMGNKWKIWKAEE